MGYVYTFLIGGAICAVGQLLMDATKLTAPRVLVIFVVAGAVLQGMQLYEPLKLVPGNGVYFVSVETVGRQLYGMCNIGHRPTVGSGNARTIETNIFGFDEDIYGLDIKLTFFAKIRDEVRFDSLEDLKTRLENDRETSLVILSEAKDLKH